MTPRSPSKTDYSQLSAEQLLDLLEKRDRTINELAKARLGLVWERSELEPEVAENDDFVALHIQPEYSYGTAPFENLIIEGDNFDALRALRISHRGRVKCIYIDPPYNTGKKDFIYNDSFVDKDHRYRHSLWLDFMYKRLVIARDLLADDGAMFISIGDEEHARLELLMEEVMPGRKLGTFVVKVRSGSNDASNMISTDHEYVVCYANPGFSFQGSAKVLKNYGNPDQDPRGDWTSGDLLKGASIYERPNTFYPLYNPDTDIWYPANPNSVWRFSTEKSPPRKKVQWTIEKLIQDKRIEWKDESEPLRYDSEEALRAAIERGEAPADLRITLERETLQAKANAGELKQAIVDAIPSLSFWVGKRIGRTRPRYKRFEKDLRSTEKPISTLVFKAGSTEEKEAKKSIEEEGTIHLNAGTTTDGTRLLRQMLPHAQFQYPKPLELIKGLISQATRNDDEALILDFFAGSGTKGHAVLELNDEEGSRKRFILVSNREFNKDDPSRNICRDVTMPRVRKAITGYQYKDSKGVLKDAEDLGGGFAYLEMSRIPRTEVHTELREEQTWIALLLMNDLPINPLHSGLWHSESADRRIIHLRVNPSEDDIASVKALLASSHKFTTIYARRPKVAEEIFGTGPRHTFVEIPQEIVRRFWR